jgi:hypothetical protein
MSFMKRFLCKYLRSYLYGQSNYRKIFFSSFCTRTEKGIGYKLLDIIGDLKYLKSFHIAF